MKMGKKVREYKSGDFIFAKVKGYPAWPARVQKLNGKKYFVYFYGTGETANLPPNMIFDYAENKDKFLTKTVKRRDFNDGVKQIEYDFANNVPLEQVIGVATEPSDDAANDTANDTANEVDDSTADTTAADDTMADESAVNTTQNDTGIEDSDETGGLVIDEAKAKGKKSVAKTPGKETPKAPPKTPRGKGKKEEGEDREKEKEEELVSRSGRKIRPKRYMDEHTEENTTLPSPAQKKRRGASPAADREKEARDKSERIIKHFNSVPQSELEDLKEPFTPDDPDKENILIAYLPSGQYVGIKLFQSRPATFKNEAARLQWDKQAATNAITLKMQLERGHITVQSVLAQLNMDLSLTDEEKAMLDKERETEEKKSRVQFLKTEMKLIELDAKIKTCLCLEKAETELCLKLLDELMELEVKPLMLLKHPSCLETIKRMRAYVGNTPSWDLSESAALVFSKHAHRIRKLADTIYNNMRQLFTTPEGLSFWEYFSERVMQFKKVTSKLSADELLELVHEPIEMSQPSPHTMKSAVESANDVEASVESQKKKPQTGRNKKNANTTPSRAPLKRQNSKKHQNENEEEADKSENDKDKTKDADNQNTDTEKINDTEIEANNTDDVEESTEKTQESEQADEDTEENTNDDLHNDTEKANDTEMEVDASNLNDEEEESKEDSTKESESPDSAKEKSKDSDKEEAKDKKEKDKPKDGADKSKDGKDKANGKEKSKDNGEKKDSKDKAKESTERKDRADKRKLSTDSKSKEPSPNADEKVNKEKDSEKEKEKDSPKEDEPRAKRTRESKKTEQPPPRSPMKRKSKV
ncbi:PC4 and SFRS1-interacting protein [Zerene cesonia]|uniref:PC4 and SFRS1-interacting protein n=1 Tax=Zerene cesonia TaxID=33412 RepID=UPI0018E4DFA4|nr:PC4 and SFRS1-interacting protein [Zerene cesonia]XP_038217646.1 PC4 and SFRS1-interacting protein [Zerene cesonia]